MKQNLVALLCSTLALCACAKTKTESTSSEHNTKPSVNSPTDPNLQKKIDQLVEKTKKNMIFVEGGEFLMGDFGRVTPELEKTVPNSAAVKNPKGNTQKIENLPFIPTTKGYNLHKVILDDFSMNAYKTTINEYNLFAQAKGYPLIPTILYKPEILDEVAAGVSWYQGKEYCNWLGKQVGEPMDLPTEAQWEYAARNKGQYILFATDTGNIKEQVNLWSLSQFDDYKSKNKADYDDIHETFRLFPAVGKTPASPLGFYDLVTSNYEWMNDWYAEEYLTTPVKNPQGPQSGVEKVLRSSPPMGADNLAMMGGMTVIRSKALPKANPEKRSSYLYNSVRCSANTPNPIK